MGVIVRPELNPGMKPVFGSGYRLNPYHPLNQGLVAWWLMNEGAGTHIFSVLRDQKSRSSITAGNPTWVNNSLYWDGTATSWALSTLMHVVPFTIVVYANTIDLVANRVYVASGDGGPAFFGISSSGNKLRLNRTGVATVATSTGAFSLGIFSTLSVSCDGSNYAFHINGVPAGSGSSAVAFPGDSVWRIGSEYSGARVMYGTIADVKIYNRILSSSEQMQSTYLYGTPSNPRLLFPSSRKYFYPTTGPAPSFKPYWIPRQSHIIGGGLGVS